MYTNIANKSFQKNPDVVTRIIGGTVLLIPIKRRAGNKQSVILLNATAAFIWERLDGINTMAAVKSQLQEEYEVPSEQLESDILDFIRTMEPLDLMRPPNQHQPKGQTP